MIIAIPTRARVGDQQTIRGLSDHLRTRTILFCPQEEMVGHAGWLKDRGWGQVRVVGQPEDITTIAAKRAWMLRYLDGLVHTRVLMLDDDLFFYQRYWNQQAAQGRGDWRLLDAEPHQVEQWFGQLEARLSPDTPHAGFGPRQGNNNMPSGWVEGTRMMLALGYHIPTVLENVVLGRIETREDMDISLQLLRRGLPNLVTHEFCVGQKSYAAPGGCTGQRTTESSDADAHRLAELHPGLVRVVDREYKGHPRKEVVVSWKRALAEGRARPLGLDAGAGGR